MPVSGRVRADDKQIADFHGDYIIGQVGKKFRVYEDASEYSSTSGGVNKRGKVMRDADDKPISFDTVERARSWIDKGCVVYPEILY